MPKMKHILKVLLPLLLLSPAVGAEPRLEHPVDAQGRRVSGDNQPLLLGGEIILRALVLDEAGEPGEGVPVIFSLVGPWQEDLGEAVSDRNGIASTLFRVGRSKADYTVTARLHELRGPGSQIVYRLHTRKGSWVFFMLCGLAGGLGLFLFGMNMMSNTMQRSAAGKMRAILGALTKNRFIGVAVGAFVTMVIQSSSATTVMLVSFVQAGLMSFTQTVGVILGADIGTTITAQLIAFKLTDYALLMIAVGFGLKVLVKRNSIRNTGEVLLGFGILFFGMHVMSSSMSPLSSYKPFLDLLRNLENPLLGIIVGTVFTALIQSSSAFTGIIIVLAQQGFISLEAAIPLIFGANIGTCVTALLASLGAGREARRVALAHSAFKILGVLLVVAWIPAFADLVRSISPKAAAQDISGLAAVLPRQVANAHTIFNVGLALVFLPFTGLAARLFLRIMPERAEPELEPLYRARFLDSGMLSTPTLALNLARVEILRMGDKVKAMLAHLPDLIVERKLDTLDELHELEDKIDALDEQVNAYLINIGKQSLSDEQTEEVYLMMHVAKQFEHIADIIDKEIRPLGRKMLAEGVQFSDSGLEELLAYHTKAVKQIARGLVAFREGSLDKARRMTKKEAKYLALEDRYRKAHFERIHSAVSESLASSEIHLDLMDAMRKINSYSVNIARALLAKEERRRESSREGG